MISGCSLKFGFDGEALAEAIRLTLENRGTELPQAVTAFTEEFVDKKAGIGRRSTSVWRLDICVVEFLTNLKTTAFLPFSDDEELSDIRSILYLIYLSISNLQ